MRKSDECYRCFPIKAVFEVTYNNPFGGPEPVLYCQECVDTLQPIWPENVVVRKLDASPQA